LQAIWGLGQIARGAAAAPPKIRERLVELLADQDAEVRAQAAGLLGEVGDQRAADAVCRLLVDESPRVRYFAAQSLGKLAAERSFDDVVDMLAENNNRDPIVRHGGIMALSRIANDDQLTRLASHDSMAVRLAAVVALRRQASSLVATFLADESELVVREAARAIHDEPVQGAMPALAALISTTSDDDALMRRVLNANFRLGTSAHAEELAQFAARGNAPSELRLEAIEMLGTWAEPGGRDRVLGMWRPLENRDAGVAVSALRPLIAGLADGDSEIRLAAARVASELEIPEAAPVLVSLVNDRSVRARERADALRALVKMTGSDSLDVVRQAVGDGREIVRAAALQLLPDVDPTGAVSLLERPALEGLAMERQAAIEALGKVRSEDASQVLSELMKQLIEDELAPEVQLDTLAAARGQSSATLDSLIAEYESGLDPDQRIDQYRAALHGGDAESGRQIFFERTAVSCVRCHKVGRRGGEVGPELSRIGADKDRKYLLEALVDPNKTIAEGFASVALIDDAGKTHVGVLRQETETTYTLVDANANVLAIPKDTVEEKFPSQSAMPDDVVTQLTKEEIRDLVEFLASLDGRGFRGFGRSNRDD
jgi:quinoprotein glucose dehydrogenase